MARSYGVLKSTLWEPGSDFRQLDPLAQWGYTMLISQPQISNLGILAYTPEKWARLAVGLTVEIVEGALAIIEAARYILVDLDTGELLVRTFVRHDKVWSQPRLVTNARKLIREVESERIRAELCTQHPWLVNDWTKEEILAFEEAQETPSDTPPDRGSNKGVSKGVSIPLSTQRAPAGPGAGAGSSSRRTSSSRTEVSYDARDDREPAAADTSTEAPRESRIAEVIAELPGADLDTHRVVEPLARQLPRVLFDDIEVRLRDRIRTGSATNPPGLLVAMLQTACKQQAIRARPATARLDHRARLVLEASSYAKAGHDWDVVEPLLRNNLRRHDVPHADRDALMTAAVDAYRASDRERAAA